MSKAELCPVCRGSGNKNGVPDNPGGTNEFCKGCGGTGWVEVSDIDTQNYPFYEPNPWAGYPFRTWSG